MSACFSAHLPVEEVAENMAYLFYVLALITADSNGANS